MTAHISIQREDFDLTAESEKLAAGRTDIGAVVTFSGLVRGEEDLASLTLEHYPGMTEREIARHVAEAQARWPLLGVTVIHRIGKLLPGQRIVLVAVAAAHRAAAFEAADFLMDYLKTRAPFWKLEERDGTSCWIEAKTSDDAAAARWRRR